MKQLYLIILTLFLSNFIVAQNEYIGAGNTDGVTVTSSSDDGESTAIKTIDGSGLNAKMYEASRFLAQTTLGYSHQDIEDLVDDGLNFSTWINDQIDIEPRYHLPLLDSVFQEALDLYTTQGNDPEDYFGPWALHYNYTFWESVMTSSDQLRQRVALALSEIFNALNHVLTEGDH